MSAMLVTLLVLMIVVAGLIGLWTINDFIVDKYDYRTAIKIAIVLLFAFSAAAIIDWNEEEHKPRVEVKQGP